jgi:hypothetical protein
MDKKRLRSVFGPNKNESEQENHPQPAETQGRDLTMDEYREEQREKGREILESELRKTPEQREDEFTEWLEKWFEAKKEKERKVLDKLFKSRPYKWPNR